MALLSRIKEWLDGDVLVWGSLHPGEYHSPVAHACSSPPAGLSVCRGYTLPMSVSCSRGRINKNGAIGWQPADCPPGAPADAAQENACPNRVR